MATGLQVWDASGNILIDTSTRLGRILGYISVTADGSLNVPGLATGTGFAKVVSTTGVATLACTPETSFPDSTTLKWVYPSGFTKSSCLIIYGVY